MVGNIPKVVLLSVSPFPKNSVMESWMVENPPSPFPLGPRFLPGSFFTRPYLLESIDLVLSSVHKLICFVFPLPVDLPFAAAARNGLSKLSFTGWRKLLVKIKSWCGIAIQQYLEFTQTAMTSAAVTVEADGRIKFSRRSSSGCFFTAIVVPSHRVLNNCT